MHFNAKSFLKSRYSLESQTLLSAFLNPKNFYSQLSLRGKISFPFVLIFLGIWLLGTASLGIYVSRSLERRTRHENQAIATLILREFQQQKRSLRLNAKLLAENSDLREIVEEKDSVKLLQELISLKTSLSINFLEIFDRENHILADLKHIDINDLDLSSQTIRTQVLSGLSFTSILSAKNANISLLIGASSIASRQGTVGGIIIGSTIDKKLLEQIVSETGQHLAVFEQERLIASTLSEENEEVETLTALLNSLQQRISTVRIRDRDYFTHTASLSGLQGSDFKLMVLNPLDSLQQDRQKLWWGIILVSLTGGICAIAMGYWVSGKILRRIESLTRATRKLAKGDLTTRCSIISRDEIGQLGANFNTMAEELVSREDRLNQQMQQIEATLAQLRMTQAQLVQSEKMSSLGQMVAGIAHEINNPVNFIHGNLGHTSQYTQDLITLVHLYESFYPQPVSEIADRLEQIDLEFLAKDLPKLLASMQIGTNRIREIVVGLRNFSRLDESDLKEVEIHSGIESTLLIVQHRFKARSGKPDIEILKEYTCYPLKLKCYAGQLNQVFLNLLVNAIDALETIALEPQIKIHSSVDGDWVKIAIADNGKGIPENIRGKIFDPFFTTKPVGQGTGLGLAIAYQIILKHQGTIECLSQIDRGTEFIIKLPLQ